MPTERTPRLRLCKCGHTEYMHLDLGECLEMGGHWDCVCTEFRPDVTPHVTRPAEEKAQ